MNTIKKIASMFLALCLAIPFGSALADVSVSYTPGVYTGISENGKGGNITVAVTFSDNKIEDIQVTEQNETPTISDAAFERIPMAVVEYQSLAIDAMSGATITSEALLEAIANAVEQAGGDVEALKQNIVEKELSTAVVDMNATVVIAGCGAAGMAAAMSASSNGAESVVVVEKESSIGGNAIVSGGYMDTTLYEDIHPKNNDGYKQAIETFLANGPQNEGEEAAWPQLEAEYQAYLDSGSDKVFDSVLYWTIDFARLESNPFKDAAARMKRYEICDEFVSWFTDETGAEWNDFAGIIGFSWPRWTSLKGYYSGQGYFSYFEKWIQEKNANITILTDTAAMELIQDETGKVLGLTAKCSDGTTYNIYGEKGTILCTGGFAYNREMVKEYDQVWGDLLTTDILTTNAAGATGEGILMAKKAGAAVDGLGNTMLFPLTDIKTGSTEAIVGMTASLLMVNQEGKRFVNETTDRYTISGALLQQTGKVAYAISCEANSLIVDGKTTGGTDIEQMLKNGELFRADTLEELALQAGIDPEALKETVEDYNNMCSTYVDEQFGRTTFEPGSEIVDGPFYAYPCAAGTHITLGGVIADEYCRVLDTDNNVMEGLYAAGEVVNEQGGIDCGFSNGKYVGDVVMGKVEVQ